MIEQDEVLRMAREAGFTVDETGKLLLWEQNGIIIDKEGTTVVGGLKKFAALVAAHEREKLKAPRMTLGEIKKLGGHRPMTPWVVSVVIEAMAIEREACAKVCDELVKGFNEEADNSRLWCAAAIRSRSSEHGAKGEK